MSKIYPSNQLIISTLVLSIRDTRKQLRVDVTGNIITEFYQQAEIEYVGFSPVKVTFYDGDEPEVFEVKS